MRCGGRVLLRWRQLRQLRLLLLLLLLPPAAPVCAGLAGEAPSAADLVDGSQAGTLELANDRKWRTRYEYCFVAL
jgi:hypothetical protein